MPISDLDRATHRARERGMQRDRLLKAVAAVDDSWRPINEDTVAIPKRVLEMLLKTAKDCAIDTPTKED